MSNKPRVLRIANRFNIGGPTFNVAYLTRYLENFETLLIGGEAEEGEDSSTYILDNLGIQPRIISEMKREISIADDYKAYLKIREIIREFKPHIVHTHASKPGAIGRLAAIHENVPVILHTFHGHVFHSYFGFLKTNFYKFIERYLAKRSSRVIAISIGQAHELSEIHAICKPNKINVVPLGFDLSKFNEDKPLKRNQFRKQFGLSEHSIAVCIVGRLVPIKNHRFILDVVALVKQKSGLRFQLVVVGDGEERSALEEHCRKLNLSFASKGDVDVVFTSWIKDVDYVYAGCDIAVLCSLNEGTPVSLIEAQAAGCPIVSTNVGGISNVVLPSKTALLIEKGDVKGFSEALFSLINSSELRAAMQDDGWGFVKDNFHFTRLVRDMDSLYNSLLREKKVNL